MANYTFVNGELQNADELMHYGVVGMKWGHRRATKLANKAKIARESAKEWKEIGESKAAKYKAKGKTAKAYKTLAKYQKLADQDNAEAKMYDKRSKKIKDKHISLAGGKKAYDYTVNESMGKTFAKSVAFGTYGALKYNQARAKDISKGKAAVGGIISRALNDMSSGWVGVLEPRINAKEKRKK